MEWIKLHCKRWFTGSTRWELEPSERLLFVDLLALTGMENATKGYIEVFNFDQLAHKLMVQSDFLKVVLKKLEQTGKIKLNENKIYIEKWFQYNPQFKDKSISQSIALSENSKKLSKKLAELIKINNPKNKNTLDGNFEISVKRWADDIEKINKIDNQTWDDIERVINWCQKDNFWKANILSGAKLREKFTQLQTKMLSPVVQGKKYL